ncbi:MAG TPA: UDP-N-acetylmuramate dehydrogenase [Chitinophagaceae bacterium]|nr:UDP-N-acetylmuramate dehydrogenase [Chitinophagaceae bacterium]
MQLSKDFSLKQYHTFHIDVSAKYFAAFQSLHELQHILELPEIKNEPLLILGGGSNLLFTKNFNGLVLKNEMDGMGTVHEDERHVYVKAGAGVNWHRFVLHCIHRNLAGIENLSLIPGNVGASPMQNIGAYGAEIKDVFHSLEAYHLYEKKTCTFTSNDCEFGYRESVFKRKYKNQFVILNVTFALNKVPHYNISYGAIEEELKKMKVRQLSIKAISDAVINIRTSRLPDPNVIGNAGSFFKNPQVSNSKLEALRTGFPDIPSFKADDAQVKIPAGWLIEQCGWRGFRRGDAGCYDKQALVLVNYGNATGHDILRLSDNIFESVFRKFDIKLEREVNVI